MKCVKFFLLGILTVGFCTSCSENDFLTVTNPNLDTRAQFWQNGSHAKSAIMATYSILQSPSVMGDDGVTIRSLMGDLTYPKSTNDQDNLFHVYSWNSGTQFIDSMWKELYTGVFRANQVLTYVPEITMDENEKSQILGEAHFLRALYYFWLSISYNNGEIPLVAEVPNGPDEIYNELAPRNLVYDLIYNDLNKARELLPKTWDNSNLGRATWGSATALQGKVYLYEKDYEKSLPLLESVITSGIYSLVPDPYNNFNILGEFNSESIFEVAFSTAVKDGADPTNYNDYDSPFGGEATARARRWAPRSKGNNLVMPHGLIGELLVLDTLDTSNPINEGRSFSIRSEASIGTKHDNLPYYDGVTSDVGFRFNYWGLVWRKFQNITQEGEDVVTSRSGINENVLRLADVYLMASEAIVEKEGTVTPQALEYLNIVRRRAGVIEKQMTDFPNKKSFIDYLFYYERPRELVGEGFGIRWHDLRRKGIIKEALQKLYDNSYRDFQSNNPNATTDDTSLDWEITRLSNFTPDRQYFPIPSSELTSNILLGN